MEKINPRIWRIKIKNRNLGKDLALYLLAILLLYPLEAFAISPTVQVKSSVDQVIRILTDPRLQGKAKKEEQQNLLRETIFPRFDFKEMAKRSLGTHWHRQTTEKQREFAKLCNKPLYVFDQKRNAWFSWNQVDWSERKRGDEPVISHAHFGGTGTRFLEENGKKAIKELFERTFS